MNCHCGNQKSFSKCCEPYLLGLMDAPTAETLMRSRYSAFCTRDIDYIYKTMDPSTAADFNHEQNKDWAESVEFQRLEIVRSETQNATAIVEFRAYFIFDDENHVHHEVSHFKRIDGRWFFSVGDVSEN